MPWIAVACALVFGACFFDADYAGGRIACSDGKCPSGLTCAGGVCEGPRRDAAPGDADGDGSTGDATDARIAALTCVDPGLVATTGGTAMGTTASRSSLVSASCDGFVMNGPDAVYRIDAAAGAQLLVSISASYAAYAYVLAPCSATPATPTCLTNMAASAGDPISVTTTFAGQHFIVVDNPNPALSGDFTLTVTVN